VGFQGFRQRQQKPWLHLAQVILRTEQESTIIITIIISVLSSGEVHVLQAAFVLLDLRLAAWAALGDQFGEVFALRLHAHPFIITSVIHPLGHVAAAGRVVGLRDKTASLVPQRPTSGVKSRMTSSTSQGEFKMYDGVESE